MGDINVIKLVIIILCTKRLRMRTKEEQEEKIGGPALVWLAGATARSIREEQMEDTHRREHGGMCKGQGLATIWALLLP